MNRYILIQFVLVKQKCISWTEFTGNVVSQFAPLLEEVTHIQVKSNSVSNLLLLSSTGLAHGDVFLLSGRRFFFFSHF